MCTFEILPAAGLSHHTSTAQRDWVLSPLNSNALFMLASHWVYPEFEWFAIPKTQITWHAQSACWQTGLRRLQNLTAKHRTCSTAFCREASPSSPFFLGKEKWPSFKISSSSFQQCHQPAVQVLYSTGSSCKRKSWKSGVGANKHRHKC